MEQPDQREYLMGDPPQAGVAYDLLTDITTKYLNPDVSPDDWDVRTTQHRSRPSTTLTPTRRALILKNSLRQKLQTRSGKS